VVRLSNKQLEAELAQYKATVDSLKTHSSSLQDHQTVAQESKLVTSKVRHSLKLDFSAQGQRLSCQLSGFHHDEKHWLWSV
jgi:cell division protein FtsB